MPKIKLKIHEYDIESNSLIVSFAGENSKVSVDQYPPMAFQPTMFTEIDDVEKIIEHIARTGVFHLEQQEKEDQFRENTELIEKYKTLSGKEFEFDIDELLDAQHTETFAEISVAEEILNEILIDDLKE